MMEQSLTQTSLNDNISQWKLTQTKEIKCFYQWNIDNFNNCVENFGEWIISPRISDGMNDTIKWSLHVYPKGCDENSSGFVGLFLRLDLCKKCVIARYVFSIIDDECKQTHIRKAKPIKFYQGTVRGHNNYIGREEIESLLIDGRLRICCEISVEEDTVNVTGQGTPVQVKVPRGCILDDFGKLFDEMKLSDVTLVASGKEIRGHKLILAARSAVFAAMFAHDMQEQKMNRVDITDVGYEVLTEMLRFIYTDRATNLNKMAADLFVAADKYALDNLKVICEEALCRFLSVETAADALVLADLYSIERLKKHTIAFINSSHIEMVMATEGWKKMTSTHLHLVAELFSNMAAQVQQHLPMYTFTSCKTQLRSDIAFEHS